MTMNILVVCGSDACLGPAVAVALRAGLDEAGVVGSVTVQSAGVRAEVGTPWCAESAKSAGSSSDQTRWVHRARQISGALVLEADVILATERRYRSAPRVWDVHSAQRTFTALEAAVLGAAVVQRCDSDPGSRARRGRVANDCAAQLAWLVEEMDALRGIVAMPTQQHGLLPRNPRSCVVGIDVLDPHTIGGNHRHAVSALDRAMRSFAVTVARVTSQTVPV